MFSPIVRNRYLCGSWPQLVDRLISGPIWKMYKFGPISIDETEKLHWALANQVFIPAGNTLTFNAPVRNNTLAHKLRPNCAIKVGISTDDAVRLWLQGTGFAPRWMCCKRFSKWRNCSAICCKPSTPG